MLVTLLGIVILVRPLQAKKAEEPMLVPLVILTTNEAGLACSTTVLTISDGPVMLVSPVQYAKALEPMRVTLSGIVMLVSPVQPRKA